MCRSIPLTITIIFFNHDVGGSTQPGWQAVIVLITADDFPLHGIRYIEFALI
jgi:hypothetical protein